MSSLLKTFYTKDTQQYPYDKKKAEALLDEAGFPRKPDGWRFKLNHDYIPFGDDYRRTGEFVRQSLRAIGIDVTLRGQDRRLDQERLLRLQLPAGQFLGHQLAGPADRCRAALLVKAEAKGTPWQNASGYASAEADRLLEAARRARSGPACRAVPAVPGVAQRDLALLNLFEFRWFGVWDKRLRNVTDTFDHSQNNFARVWLATK